ncbi:hypothetical protein PHET_01478 [Paragonimus heterotremus]|uniref:Uncharacterized protein n=1 Tax=Paragonimus heterotremus TaxID=100268 RepID=A0A8J4TMB9_9TREM|nr:hypothetical protein PHET_01478 [Paragonimus heterotremus]
MLSSCSMPGCTFCPSNKGRVTTCGNCSSWYGWHRPAHGNYPKAAGCDPCYSVNYQPYCEWVPASSYIPRNPAP